MIGDFNGWDPRANPMRGSDAGIWSAKVRGSEAGQHLQVPRRFEGRQLPRRQVRPVRVPREMPPRTGSMVWKLDYEWNDAEWMKNRKRAQRARRALVDLRDAPRLLAARSRGPEETPLWQRNCPDAGRLREAHGLHPRRADAGDGAPVLRLLGLPDHRLLRAERALRHAAGLHVPGRRTCTRRASA